MVIDLLSGTCKIRNFEPIFKQWCAKHNRNKGFLLTKSVILDGLNPRGFKAQDDWSKTPFSDYLNKGVAGLRAYSSQRAGWLRALRLLFWPCDRWVWRQTLHKEWIWRKRVRINARVGLWFWTSKREDLLRHSLDSVPRHLPVGHGGVPLFSSQQVRLQKSDGGW